MAMPFASSAPGDPVECTPSAVRAALADLADADTLAQYDHDLDAAYKRARAESDLAALIGTVRRWWFEVDAMRDAERYQDYTRRIAHYQTHGPPPADQRIGRAELCERFGL